MEKRECECVICKKTFISNRVKAFTCGKKKCVTRNNYLRHRQYYIDNARRWDMENPEKKKVISKKSCDKFRKNHPDRFNELMRNNYRKNKKKWNSRNITGNIVNGRRYTKYNSMRKNCKCGSVEDLEIHHDIYPTTVKEIRKAMDDGKIYYKCRKCHGRRNNHTQMNNDKEVIEDGGKSTGDSGGVGL